MENEKKNFHTLSIEETFSHVRSSAEGLSAQEAEKRLEEYGPNALPEPERAGWYVLLYNQFKSFLILILLAAAVISFLLHDKTDAYIIVAAVLMNVIFGFIQESKAEKSLESLRKVITLEAKVARSGKEEIIDIKELVPGDIILLNAGDKIPADARLIEVSDLEVNEAALTGESAAVKKQLESVDASAGVGDRKNMIFIGTTVVKGSARAVVVQTGLHTEMGHIAELLKETKSDATPLQKKLDRFARNVGLIILVICAVIIVIGLVKGMAFVEIFTTAVAIAVSAIPEGLVVAVTVILSIGMQRILKRKALVRNLQAAETLGSTSVICTDKTGTITEGNMQVVSLVTSDYHYKGLNQVERHEQKGLRELIFALNIGMLCNDAHIIEQGTQLKESVIVGNLTERALLAAGMNIGLDQAKLRTDEPRIATVPFDSKIKYMATLHEHPKGGRRIYVKGAPEKIIAMSKKLRSGSATQDFSSAKRKKFEEQFIEFSEQGLRILALAYKDVPKSKDDLTEDDCKELVFVGFVGIKDPLREGISETFKHTADAGVTTVMITGDHKITAKAIAQEVGLRADDSNILEGEELHNMTQEQLNERVQDISVYARVSPEDKLNIIKAWKENGKVVAMTGDGVNDSPALKAADIGVALGSGTDVAKEASDMVLLDDNYQTTVAAVEEGRGIFDNIRKVVLYLMSDSFSEMILIIGALLIGVPVPLTAAQILWINIVGDGLPNMALALEPKEAEAMDEPPRALDEPVMNSQMKTLMIIISLVTGFINLGVFMYFWKTTNDVVLARSVVFASIAVDSLLYLFSVRSMRHSIISKQFYSNKWLFAAVFGTMLIMLAAFYIPFLQNVLKTTPIGLFEWGVVFAVSIGVIIIIEAIKYIFIVSRKKEPKPATV